MRLFLKNNYLLIILIFITFLKGAVWAAATPLFQAPDEQYHYATIQYYALPEGYQPPDPEKFPVKKTRSDDISTQNLSPELRSILEKTEFDKIRWKPDRQMLFAENSAFGIGESELRSEKPSRFIERFPPWYVHYGPVYYKAMSFIENAFQNENIVERVYLIRMFSVLLGTLLVLVAYFIFRELNLDKVESVILAGIVSFQPTLTFINSSINVDPLLFFAFTLFILGSVRILRNKVNIWSVSFLVFGMILGILTKPPGHFLAAMLPILIFFYLRLHQKQKMDSYSRKTKFFGAVLFAAAILGIIYYTFQNKLLGFLKITPLVLKYIVYELTYDPTFGRTASYWGTFGWVDTHLARFFVFSIGILLAISVIGIVKYFIKRWRARLLKKTDQEKIFLYQILYFLLFATGLNLAIHAVNLRYANPENVADQSRSIGLQGRYFFPVIIPQMALFAFGFSFLFSKINRKWIFLAILVGMIFLNFWSLFNIVIPRYYL